MKLEKLLKLPKCPDDGGKLEPWIVTYNDDNILYALKFEKCGSYVFYDEPPSDFKDLKMITSY